jgi:hypothetical protein
MMMDLLAQAQTSNAKQCVSSLTAHNSSVTGHYQSSLAWPCTRSKLVRWVELGDRISVKAYAFPIALFRIRLQLQIATLTAPTTAFRPCTSGPQNHRFDSLCITYLAKDWILSFKPLPPSATPQCVSGGGVLLSKRKRHCWCVLRPLFHSFSSSSPYLLQCSPLPTPQRHLQRLAEYLITSPGSGSCRPLIFELDNFKHPPASLQRVG